MGGYFPDENLWDHIDVDTGSIVLIVAPLVFHRYPIDLEEPIYILNLSVRRYKLSLELVPFHVESFAPFSNVRR